MLGGMDEDGNEDGDQLTPLYGTFCDLGRGTQVRGPGAAAASVAKAHLETVDELVADFPFVPSWKI